MVIWRPTKTTAQLLQERLETYGTSWIVRVALKKFQWQHKAKCLGENQDIFFPDQGESTLPGKEICRQCRVQVECLAYAMTTSQQKGTWGGMSPHSRRDLRLELGEWFEADEIKEELKRFVSYEIAISIREEAREATLIEQELSA